MVSLSGIETTNSVNLKTNRSNLHTKIVLQPQSKTQEIVGILVGSSWKHTHVSTASSSSFVDSTPTPERVSEMNSTVMYSIVNKRGAYDILPVDSTQNSVYEGLCLAVSTKDLDKVLQIFESKEPTYTVVNQPIFLCNPECAYTNCIALNLCHFAVYNDCKDILEVLLKNGGDLSQKTFEVTLSKNTRHFVEKDSLIDLIVRHFNEPVKYLQDIFDQYICSADLGSTYEFQFDFSILCPSFNMGKHLRQSERQMCVLNEIVNSSYDIYSPECGLLQHPLIETYLTCKWSHYRRFFYILVALHVFFVACLSSIALLIVGNFHKFSELQNSTLAIESFEEGRVGTVLAYIKVLDCLLLALGSLLFGHALIQTFFIPLRRLLYEFEILSNLFTSGLALLICTCGIVFPMQWIIRNHLELTYTFNSLIILPAWINLMLIIGRIPSLGCYSLMFTTVMKNFLKVMISFVFLIIGFALSFSLVFPMSEVFNNPVGAVLRTFVMMLGEFNFSETFAVNAQFLNGLSKFIFVLFIVSCSIILMNLTQGIAVNDIKLLHEISQIVRLEKETRFLYEFESIFTQGIMTSNPALRKIKRRLYDAGAIKSDVTISSKARRGVSQALFARLVQLYKPTRRLTDNSPHHPRFHFKCFADRYTCNQA